MAASGGGDWLKAKHGFRFWLDPVLRQQVFYRVFDGPLSMAVCERLGAGPMALAVGCGGGEAYPPSSESQDVVEEFVTADNTRLAGASGRAARPDTKTDNKTSTPSPAQSSRTATPADVRRDSRNPDRR